MLVPFGGVWTNSFGFQIPWECLKDQIYSSQAKSFHVAQAQKKTCAQALNNVCDISLLQLHSPCIKEDLIFVWIDEVVYLEGLEDCKNHLHERIK